jgi:hypothetical protein
MATRASYGASSAIERLNLNSTATLQRGFKAKKKATTATLRRSSTRLRIPTLNFGAKVLILKH